MEQSLKYNAKLIGTVNPNHFTEEQLMEKPLPEIIDFTAPRKMAHTAGVMEAQIIMYQIINECKYQITPDDLLKEFMNRTQSIINKP